ncbi:hypothetical protein B5M09_012971 [Aphanomyces astaci]|uniref:Uncharacterized protein n=1 Tax=Aphanomyces astaci TaxID=112090 RepID=A0A3R7WJD6_APHAT|nr:hypothetical protein B5M09_012971 [Aphanomyces astaci]
MLELIVLMQGEYLRHKYGLMSYHENYLFIKGTVCANILLRHDIFRAHCHVIAENQVDKTVIRVFRKDITLKQLFNLSLRPLA